MNFLKTLAGIALSAAFVAGTLQGSRLPQDANDSSKVELAAAHCPANRAGSGAGPDESPPPGDGILA